MHILATQPDLCKFAVESGLAVTLLQLLAHENSDIISATINLLQVGFLFKEVFLFCILFIVY